MVGVSFRFQSLVKPNQQSERGRIKNEVLMGKGCSDCYGGERMEMPLFRRHSNKDALDVGKMKDFVFFTTEDPDCYDD